MRSMILVVDDDIDARDTVGELLRIQGHEVALAADGREALTAMQAGPPPQLVLLDLRMPVMDGWELLAAKARIATLRAIPVIVISAEPDAASRLPVPSVVALLSKPLRANVLIQTVRDALEPVSALAVGTGSVPSLAGDLPRPSRPARHPDLAATAEAESSTDDRDPKRH